MTAGLRGRALAAGGVLVVISAAVFSVLLVSIEDLRDSGTIARHSSDVIAAANRLERLVIDVETGQRGYVVAADESFLEPWSAARASFPAEAETLVDMVVGEPGQQERARGIEAAGRRYIEDWSARVVATAREDLEAGRGLVASGEGKRQVDEIRRLFSEFVAAERQLAEVRASSADSAATRAIALGAAALGVSALLALLFTAYLSHAVAGPLRRLSAAAGRLAGGDLTARVPGAGPAEVEALAGSFNEMAGALQESRDELEAQNVELEERELELLAANERLRAFIESSPLAVVSYDPDGVVASWNPAAERIFGWGEAEAVGRLIPFVPDDRQAEFRSFVARAWAGEQWTELELERRRKDGTAVSISASTAPVRDGAGRVVAVMSMIADVTERRQIENRLREATALLRSVVESSPLGIVAVDGDGLVRLWSSGAERLFGWKEADVVGRPPPMIPGDRADEVRRIQAAVRGGESLTGIETQRVRRDGTVLDVLMAFAPLPGTDGGIMSVTADIGERKEAEARIRDLLAELEAQNAELELQTAELEEQRERLERANDELEAHRLELERALGELGGERDRVAAFYEFGELLASERELRPLAERALRALCGLAEADVGAVYALLDETAEQPALVATNGLEADRLPAGLRPDAGLAGRALGHRTPVVASHGEAGIAVRVLGDLVTVHHELHLPLSHGEGTLGVVTLARLADRSFAPDELEAVEHLAGQLAVALARTLAYAEAARQAAIVRGVLDATPDGMAMLDLESTVLFANTTMEAHAAELLGNGAGAATPRQFLHEAIPSVAGRVAEPDAYLAGLAAIRGDAERTWLHEYQLAESGRRYVRLVVPLRDASGAVRGRVAVVRDVTAEREADRLKSELVATVSHELRTPLSSILGFTEVLLARDPEPRTRRRHLETILAEARRLTSLIDDFLDLQRIESGTFELALQPVDVGDLLREQAAVYAAQSSLHDVQVAIDGSPLTVSADRDRIVQVVANLLSNAIKYSPAGGPVTVEAHAGDGAVRVTVADAGVGIPADQQDRVFERFFRADSSDTRRIGGTGLGLALCREIVEAHGGRIGFSSREGAGSSFWFELLRLR